MDATIEKRLQATACKVRMGIIEGTYCAKSGHPGGSLSIADLLTYLYFVKLNVDPKHPDMPERDRFVLHPHSRHRYVQRLPGTGYFCGMRHGTVCKVQPEGLPGLHRSGRR